MEIISPPSVIISFFDRIFFVYLIAAACRTLHPVVQQHVFPVVPAVEHSWSWRNWNAKTVL